MRGAGDQRAGQGQALALAARERHAALADQCVVALGQALDEVVGLGGLGRRDHHVLRVGRLAAAGSGDGRATLEAKEDVVADRGGKEEGILAHEADVPAQLGQRELTHVDAVEHHPAHAHVVEAGDQGHEAGLARAGGAEEGHDLVGADVEGDVVQHRASGVVAEGDVLEAHPTLGVGEGERGRGTFEHPRRVEHLEEAARRGDGLGATVDQGNRDSASVGPAGAPRR